MNKQDLSDKYCEFYNSIRFKYMVYLLLSACLIFAVLLGYNYILFQRVVQTNANVRSNEITKHIVTTTNTFFIHITKITNTLKLSLMDNRMTEDELEKKIRDVLLDNPEIHACRVGFEAGQFKPDQPFALMAYYTNERHPFLQVDIEPDTSYTRTKDYLDVMTSGKAFFSAPRKENILDSIPAFAYVLPIAYTDKEGKYCAKGALSVYVSVNWFNKWMEEKVDFPEGYIAILGPQKELIAHTADYEEDNLMMLDTTGGSRNIKLMLQELENKESGVSIPLIPFNNYENAGLERLGIGDWNVAVMLNDKLLFKDANMIYANLMKMGMLGLVLLVLIFYFIIARITKPLSRLADSANIIASGNFDVQVPYNKGRDEVAQLTYSMQTMIDRLKIYFEEIREKERMEGEMHVAREIQQTIVPSAYPAFPQLYTIDVFGKVESAKDVGGDFFDYVLFKERYLIFAVGDVSGTGVPAALLMAIARTFFRVNASGFNPGDIVTRINKEMCLGNETNMFVTFFAGILDSQTGVLRYTNAGHHYPILRKANGSVIELNQTHGIPLGMLDTLTYRSDKIQMSANDVLVLFTDGVNEARNQNNGFFGIEGIKEYMKGLSLSDNVNTITNRLVEQARSYSDGNEEHVDDITVLTIKYLGEDLFTMKIDSNVKEVKQFQRKFFEYCSGHRVPEEVALKINLALEELLMNIISYAYGNDEHRPIFIQMQCNGKEFKAIIKDMGPPFDIKQAINPDKTDFDSLKIGGWGIVLVQHIMDKIEYTRTADFNIVSLFKNIENYEVTK